MRTIVVDNVTATIKSHWTTGQIGYLKMHRTAKQIFNVWKHKIVGYKISKYKKIVPQNSQRKIGFNQMQNFMKSTISPNLTKPDECETFIHIILIAGKESAKMHSQKLD